MTARRASWAQTSHWLKAADAARCFMRPSARVMMPSTRWPAQKTRTQVRKAAACFLFRIRASVFRKMSSVRSAKRTHDTHWRQARDVAR